jgi:Fe-S oxidoreductase
MSSFDARNQRLARSLVSIFRAADVKFAILGLEESCSGDPARRAGNEYLFQILAQQNVETLNQYNPKRIVANCAHCFNTLKNEYPQFGGHFEVIHHTQFINELIQSGRLNLPEGTDAQFAFHDPCYIGRYNDVYVDPRNVLNVIDGGFVEMRRSREQSFCCGAGGARAFMEENRGTRINTNRLQEALDTPAKGIAVGCPFCVTMFEDGVRALNVEETFQVRDLAEIVAEALEKQSSKSE